MSNAPRTRDELDRELEALRDQVAELKRAGEVMAVERTRAQDYLELAGVMFVAPSPALNTEPSYPYRFCHRWKARRA
jgi:hypothetical protein